MRLLFDENLSYRIPALIQDIFPASTHVRTCSLEQKEDTEIWDYAKTGHFTIITKDADFNDLVTMSGPPPKVVWLRIGNCRVTEIEQLIRQHQDAIAQFIQDPVSAILEIFQ